MCRLSWNLGASASWNPQGLSRPVMGLLYLFTAQICTSISCVFRPSHRLLSLDLKRSCKLAMSQVSTEVCEHVYIQPPWQTAWAFVKFVHRLFWNAASVAWLPYRYFSIRGKHVKSTAPNLPVQSFMFGRLAKLTVFLVAFLCPSSQIPV